MNECTGIMGHLFGHSFEISTVKGRYPNFTEVRCKRCNKVALDILMLTKNINHSVVKNREI
jgi:hypothetical protein